MNLQFTNKGGNFVSEFEVTSDFNLHIEGVRLSDMHIGQKTAGGSYAEVTDFPSERSQDRVADFDFASLVYPKVIKVVCTTEPTYAEIATDGEVTEIKSQSKEVEITSNGVTEIAPDAGFGYLSGVKVNVNVPTGGGSGGGSGESGGGNIEYLDMSNARNLLDYIGTMSIECKGISDAISIVAPTVSVQPMVEAVGAKITQIKVDWDGPVIQNIGGQIIRTTVLDSLLKKVSQDELDNIPRITKEEFYAL